MDFYQVLQLSPFILKNKIKAGESVEEKRFYRRALIVRSFLIVLFASVSITMISAVFGQEQSTLAVVLFCMLMSIRFVDFGYRVKQGIIGLGVVLLLLLFSPQIAAVLPSGWKFICHFCSLLMIFLLTGVNRQFGNPSLYSFCYVFLVGTLPSKEFFVSRFILVCLAFILFSWIYFRNHREKHQEFSLYKRIVGERIWSENNQF